MDFFDVLLEHFRACVDRSVHRQMHDQEYAHGHYAAERMKSAEQKMVSDCKTLFFGGFDGHGQSSLLQGA